MKITTSITKLRAAGACKPRLAVLMNELCGAHIDLDSDLNKQIVRAISEMGDHVNDPINALDILHSNGAADIEWLLDSSACHQDTAPALAEYERVKAPAWAEYLRVTAQALAEYERVKATAWAEYLRVTAPAWATILEGE